MPNTTLRAYLDELNVLLDKEALEEVIGHCRHILQHFPKNVETYRILGRALLERGRTEEAAEVFQRTLAAVPDDFTAHVGLSSAYEHSDLNSAIWHLERAYEEEPTNVNLQDEIRKLYGQRDGAPPEAVQLSRGALARLYVKGQLYDLATQELQNALNQTPNRLDLMLLLARTLWDSEHPVEAGEVALRILEKLPDCVEANRILTALWVSCGRPAEAEPFLVHLEQADPFLAWKTVYPDSAGAPPGAFQLPRLMWDARTAAAMATDVPDWVANIGDVFAAPDSVQLSTADMSTFSAPPPPSRFTPPPPAADWLTDLDSSPASEPSTAQNEVPDWYAELSQETPADQGTPANAMAWLDTGPLPDLPDTSGADAMAWLDTGPLPDLDTITTDSAADAMSWLQTGPLPDLPDTSASVVQESTESNADAMAWLDTGPLPDLDTVTTDSAADAMSWLQTGSLPDLSDTSAPATVMPETELVQPAAESTPPSNELDGDWMAELGINDLLSTESQTAEATSSVQVQEEPEEFDWLNSRLGLVTPTAPPASTPVASENLEAEEVDWIKSALGADTPADLAPATATEQPEAAENMDWLDTALNLDAAAPEAQAEPAWLSEPAPAKLKPADEKAPADEGFDWLTSEIKATDATPIRDDLDWMSSEAVEITPPALPADIAQSASESEPPNFDWLASASTLPAAEPPSATANENAELADLDWLSADNLNAVPIDIAPSAEDFDWSAAQSLDIAPPSVSDVPATAETAEPADLSWLSAGLADSLNAPQIDIASNADGFDWSMGQALDITPPLESEITPTTESMVSADSLNAPQIDIAPNADGFDWSMGQALDIALPAAADVESAEPADLSWLPAGLADTLSAAQPEAAPVAEGFDWSAGQDLDLGLPEATEAADVESAEPADLSWLPAGLADTLSTAQPEAAPAAEGFDWSAGQDLDLGLPEATEAADVESAEPADLSWLPAGLADTLSAAQPEIAQSVDEAEIKSDGLDWLSADLRDLELPPELQPESAVPEADIALPNAVEGVTEPEEDPMAWLKQYQTTGSIEPLEPEAPSPAPVAEIETLEAVVPPEPIASAKPLTTEDVLAWLNKQDTTAESAAPASSLSAPETPDALDWMLGGAARPNRPATDWLGKLGVLPSPAEPAPQQPVPGLEPSDQVIEDEWLRSFEADSPDTLPPVAQEETQPDSDWLSALPAIESSQEPPPPAPVEPLPAMPDEPEKTPLWKRSVVTSALQTANLKARQEELDTTFDEPDWMRTNGALGGAVSSTLEPAAPSTTGILSDNAPDWLSGLAEQLPPPPAAENSSVVDATMPEPTEPETLGTGEEMPDWLKAMAPPSATQASAPSKPLEELDFSALDSLGNTPDLNLDSVAEPTKLGNTSSSPAPTQQEVSTGGSFSFKKEPPWKKKNQAGTEDRATTGGSDDEEASSTSSHLPVWKRKNQN